MTVHYHDCEGLPISSVALGTYLGAPSDAIDEQVELVIAEAIRLGVSYVDCAANYRSGRSEAVLGRALVRLKHTTSNPVVIGTKAGYLPIYSSMENVVAADYFRAAFIDTGVVKRDWIIGDWQCFHPAYLEWQFEESKTRIGRSTIDIYYLHNPEGLIPFLDREIYLQTMRDAFTWCMKKVELGEIKFFGISTWGGLLGLVPREALSLVELHQLALEVGAGDHFKFIQAPFSAALTQALTHRTQVGADGRSRSLLRVIGELGMHFFGSAPLLHGQLLMVGCPAEVQSHFPWPSVTQSYVDFARSCPGVATAIVGTTRQSHLHEAASVLRTRPNPKAFVNFFGR